MKVLVSLFLILSFHQACIAQKTVDFEKIDLKHGFKDAQFGTSYNTLRLKMGLEKPIDAGPTQYRITNSKYLSIGNYPVSYAVASFANDKLYFIGLFIDNVQKRSYQDVLSYLTDVFGKPEHEGNTYYWDGNNLSYSLVHEEQVNKTFIGIVSLRVKKDNGRSNF